MPKHLVALLGNALNLRDSLLEQRLLESGLGELGSNVGLDGLDESLLLGLTCLLLVADPRVENGLELVLDLSLLLEEEVGVLELVGLLGNRVELLGEGNDLLDGVETLETLRDRRGVLLTGAVEDVTDAVNVVVGPFRVWGTDVLADGVKDDEEGDGENGLLVGNLNVSVFSHGFEARRQNRTTAR